MLVSIVIPTYNEKDNIKKLLPRIFDTFSREKIDGNVIVVDDNSPDGTAEEVKKLQKTFPIELIERDRKMGLGSAYVAGFKKALNGGAEVIFEMDADLSHDPHEIPRFINNIQEGNDVVVGSRLVKGGEIIGWRWHRKAISFGGNFIGRHISGIGVSDLTSGYRAYKSSVLKTIQLEKVNSKSYDFQLEMLSRAIDNGFKIGTIPIIFYNRVEGKSKLSKIDMVNFLLTAIKIRLKLI